MCGEYRKARGGVKVIKISVRLFGQHSPVAGLSLKACD